MTGTTEPGLLLVLGGGARHYREYLLAGLARRRAWLIDDAPADWQLPYLTGHSVVPQILAARLASNTNGLVKHVKRIAAQHSIAGVLTYDESLVVAAARLAETLGLPGLSVTGAESCRDKLRTRRLLTGAGMRQPRFGYASTGSEARQIAARIGYPVVVKPRGMSGSVGVARADGPRAIDAAFVDADAAGRRGNVRYNGGALVEELLHGPEISVDGAVSRGCYRPFFVAHKTVCLAPFFEESAHIVDAGDPLFDDDELKSVLGAVHGALGLRDGVTHTEVILIDEGPVIVEINARLGGDLIPYLGQRATGIAAADIAADVATGHEATWRPSRRAVAGIRFCYPPADGVLRRVQLPRTADVPGLVCARQTAPDGTVLRLPPRGYLSRYAFVVCEAPDPLRCAEALCDAVSRVSIELDPV